MTGTYKPTDYNDQGMYCFIAKVTSRGDFQDGMYMFSQTGYNDAKTDHMKCRALVLIPRTDNVIAVGYWADGNYVWNPGMRSGLLILADSALNKIITRTWVWVNYNDIYNYGDSEALDVTVAEGDGSIYVTGYLRNMFTRKGLSSNVPYYNPWNTKVGDHDCFVLKLDGDLNRIYAKSFGFISSDTNKFLTCSSIQVSRNSDHIYLGGNSDRGLFFAKAWTNFQSIAMTKITPNSATETLSIRRILLERNKAINSNEKLYFCGFTTDNNGDMIFGRLSFTVSI